MAAVNDTPDIGNIDSHESAITKKLQAADQALVAAQAAQQRLQQEQVNTGKCASKVKEVIKNKSIRAQQHIFDIKKDLPQLDDQLSKLNAQLSKLNDQKKEADKAFVEANKTLSAVNASAGSEFKKCLENPDNYQSPPIPNIEPTRGLPTPEDPTQRSRSGENRFLPGIQAPEPPPPATPFGGKKRHRKSKKHKKKNKKHTKSRRH